MSRWNDYRREKQRERIKQLKPERQIGRKTGRRFDATALAAAMLGFSKVGSW